MAGEWLEDVFGPDQVRVSFYLEPRLDRAFRAVDEYESWRSIRLGIGPSIGQILSSVFPGDRQQRFLRNAWRLVVEADSGAKVAIARPTREAALEAAEQAAARIRTEGAAAVPSLQ